MSERARVLVVDDDEAFGQRVAEALGETGMDAEHVADAETALCRLAAGSFDCLVTEHALPAMTGTELVARARDSDVDTPVVFLTRATEAADNATDTAEFVPKTELDGQFEPLRERIEAALARQDSSLHERLWAVVGQLEGATTPREIGTRVCEGVAEADPVRLAWLSVGNQTEPVTVAGGEMAQLQQRREALAATNDPVQAALDTGSVETTTVETPDGRAEIVAVPLAHHGSTHGVLALETAVDALGDRGVLAQFGTAVGAVLASTALRRDAEMFSAAVDHIESAVLVTDTTGTIEYANAATEEVTGYEVGELVGNSVTLLASEEYDEAYYEQLWTRVGNGEHVRAEITQRRKDGRQFDVDLSAAPVSIDGEIQQFVLVESDITEQKSREQRLQVFNRVIRHNLRNDLNAAEGHLSIVLEDLDDAPLQARAERVQRKIQELLTVAEKVQFVNKMVNAAGRDELPAVDLGEVVEEEVESVRERYPGATITVDSEAGLYTCGEHLHAAVHELLINAIEHNDDDPQVSVTITTEDAPEGTAHVMVADDGPGLPELERETVARGWETDLAHGSSLGLWLVRWIVTHAGGDLHLDASSDDGTLIRLSLPLVTDDEAA